MTLPDPFAAFLSAYADAVDRQDVAAFVQLYGESLQVYDLWQNWSLQGLPAWRAMATQWFSGLGEERVKVTWTQAHSEVEGALASGHAMLNYTAYSADGQPLRSLDNRITVAMRHTEDGWKVVHEHTSAPVEHGTGKALLRR
ncbi:MAG TPA: nuclear transport factor 2 family protein [Stenotrophomonas sp.]|jgi:ketosteroid isomerase-like protein